MIFTHQLPTTSTPSQFRRRLAIVAIQLIAAQVMYAGLGYSLRLSGFKAPANAPPRMPVTVGLFVCGLLSTIGSIAFVRTFARQQPPPTDFAALALQLQKQFFVGFALSEVAAIAGLLIFFLFGDLTTLTFLTGVAAIFILFHYLRVRQAAQNFEQVRR